MSVSGDDLVSFSIDADTVSRSISHCLTLAVVSGVVALYLTELVVRNTKPGCQVCAKFVPRSNTFQGIGHILKPRKSDGKSL